MISRHAIACSCLFALCLGATASAQSLAEGYAHERAGPTMAGDRFFFVPQASVEGHLQPSAKLSLLYGYQPLRVIDTATGDGVPNGELIKHQLLLDLSASLALSDRFLVGADLPFAAYQKGEVPSPGLTAVRSGKLGDLRLGARAAIVGTARDPFALGVQVDLFLPTGSKADYLSDDFVRGAPRLIASGLVAQRLLYAAAVGGLLRRHRDLGTAKIGSAFTYSAAGAVLLWDEHLQIGPELFGSTEPSSQSTSIEALLGARACLSTGIVFGAGVGTALTRAQGEPRIRGAFDLTWQPGRSCGRGDRDGDGIADADDACPDQLGPANADPKKNGCPPDRDNDGIADAKDACPDLPGAASEDPKKNGCPPDRDGDGIADAKDACPDVPGAASEDPKKNGCPPDRDNDGIADAEDACPDIPGATSADPKKNGCPPDRDNDGIADAEDACLDIPGGTSADPRKNGCPPDRDNDGIADAEDACSDQPGILSSDPKKNGCPAVAALRDSSIVIVQQIQFQFGKSKIRPQSEVILKAVFSILAEHPEITSLSIEGHTDSSGSAAGNLVLSKSRAAAVRNWLVAKGIDPSRLTFAGFGMEKPIDTNTTENGRKKNRRVEFQILSKRAQ